jgi:hypothetical protein
LESSVMWVISPVAFEGGDLTRGACRALQGEMRASATAGSAVCSVFWPGACLEEGRNDESGSPQADSPD